MSFDGMRRPSFSQANVQIAGASELMSAPNTLVVPVCALVPTPDGGHGMYVSVSGASPFLFIPVTLVERGAALEGAPVRDDGEEVARVTHSGQVPYSEFDVCEQPALAHRQLQHLLASDGRRQQAALATLTNSGGMPFVAAPPKGKQTAWWNADDVFPRWPSQHAHAREARMRLCQWSFDPFSCAAQFSHGAQFSEARATHHCVGRYAGTRITSCHAWRSRWPTTSASTSASLCGARRSAARCTRSACTTATHRTTTSATPSM